MPFSPKQFPSYKIFRSMIPKNFHLFTKYDILNIDIFLNIKNRRKEDKEKMRINIQS